jgi:hypothetical protein
MKLFNLLILGLALILVIVALGLKDYKLISFTASFLVVVGILLAAKNNYYRK